MVTSIMTRVNFDVFEKIVEFCDIDSAINLILASHDFHDLYQSGSVYIQRALALKICNKYGISFLESVFESFDQKCRSMMYKEMFYLHSVLKDTDTGSFGGVLRTMAPRVTKSNALLFEHCLASCEFQFWPTTAYTKIYKKKISTDDLEDILINGSEIARQSTMSNFFIPTGVLAHVICVLLEKYSSRIGRRLDIGVRIMECVRYFFVKNITHFDTESKIYLTQILEAVIEHRQYQLLSSIFLEKRKYNIQIDYNRLINKAVELDDIDLLETVFSENRLECVRKHNDENADERESQQVSLTNIVIDPRSLAEMISRGRFITLSFVLSNMIGNGINSIRYIEGICRGLDLLFKQGPDPDVDNTKFIARNLHKIHNMTLLLSVDNRMFINKHLVVLQRRRDIKDIFTLINPRQFHI